MTKAEGLTTLWLIDCATLGERRIKLSRAVYRWLIDKAQARGAAVSRIVLDMIIDRMRWDFSESQWQQLINQVAARLDDGLVVSHDDQRQIAALLRSMGAELEARAHYAEGTADLAMKHRDAAEAEVRKLREALAQVLEWFDRDGSVGGLDPIIEQTRAALSPAPDSGERVR